MWVGSAAAGLMRRRESTGSRRRRVPTPAGIKRWSNARCGVRNHLRRIAATVRRTGPGTPRNLLTRAPCDPTIDHRAGLRWAWDGGGETTSQRAFQGGNASGAGLLWVASERAPTRGGPISSRLFPTAWSNRLVCRSELACDKDCARSIAPLIRSEKRELFVRTARHCASPQRHERAGGSDDDDAGLAGREREREAHIGVL